MPNTCTICRHERRKEIEDKMVRGVPLRSIGKQYQTTHATLNRHRSCIAGELKAFKQRRSIQLSESLIQRLDRYREIAESPLDDADKELRLKALDRCYKLVDIEAKLTGAYQEKRGNEHDKQMEREILIERWLHIYNTTSYEEATAGLQRIYAAQTEAERRSVISDELDESLRLTNDPQGWAKAEQMVQSRYAGH
jgi:hypothetical protein